MNIVLLNQFFPPAQAPTGLLLADLARELRRRGHEVTVLASAADYGAAGQAPEAGLRVLHLGPQQPHRAGLGAKLGDYFSFYRAAWRYLAHLPARPDALVFMTTPPFIGLLGAHLQKRAGIPFVLWCMDLYPEALVAHGLFRPWNPVLPLLRQLASTERRRAAAVVALGPDMAARLAQTGAARVEEIPGWSSLAVSPALAAAAQTLRRARGWGDGEIILLYSGNMGRAHRAAEFAALAERLRDGTPRCRFVFSGGGPLRTEWEKRWGGLFEFMPPVPEADCAAHLLAADVHLVSQQPAWTGVVVPSKFQASCALGRPVVFAGPPQSAVGVWLAEADAGWLLPPGDEAALETVVAGIRDARLRAEKGARAQALFQQRFTPAANCGRLAALVENLAPGNQ